MKNYLTIDPEGLVQNLIVWDGEEQLRLATGWTVVELNEGEYYEFGKPRGIEPPPYVQPV